MVDHLERVVGGYLSSAVDRIPATGLNSDPQPQHDIRIPARCRDALPQVVLHVHSRHNSSPWLLPVSVSYIHLYSVHPTFDATGAGHISLEYSTQ
jgi:hypothetical protein